MQRRCPGRHDTCATKQTRLTTSAIRRHAATCFHGYAGCGPPYFHVLKCEDYCCWPLDDSLQHTSVPACVRVQRHLDRSLRIRTVPPRDMDGAGLPSVCRDCLSCSRQTAPCPILDFPAGLPSDIRFCSAFCIRGPRCVFLRRVRQQFRVVEDEVLASRSPRSQTQLAVRRFHGSWASSGL